ncbi:MAG: hypothetical protein K9K37_11260 [Desulfocapsa sp.]|nr:hypothetical protein [Desulfocapsa sp.]
MASIGNLRLGQVNSDGTISHPTAVACTLISPLDRDIDLKGISNGWVISGKKGHSHIVASTPVKLDFNNTKKSGVSAITQALDFICVQQNITTNISNPGDNIICLYRESGLSVLSYTATFNLAISTNLSTQRLDKYGNIKEEESAEEPKWHRSFRYYRLSQLAGDIYEAYRNLYLAFEVLAESCYPRGNNEREGAWVRRCFYEFHTSYNLSSFSPEYHPKPSEYLFGVLYEHVRCKLFHSRSVDAILPFYEIDASKIKDSYECLMGVWRHIGKRVLYVSSAGGVITYQGYRTLTDKAFTDVVDVVVTADPSPVTHEDTLVSPNNYKTIKLGNCRYAGEVNPGMVSIEATETNVSQLPQIYRLSLTAKDNLIAVSYIASGLCLEGVDRFRVRLNQRLIQGSQPKVEF